MSTSYRLPRAGALLAAALLLGAAGGASGQTLYGLTSTSRIITFNAATPSTIDHDVAITGITAGQTLVGMDSRPATGELFILGYDQPSQTASLYVLNPVTGSATGVGAAFSINLGLESASNIGFDFNPTVDRIRVVTADADRNYRLNPVTGTVAATDGNLAYLPGDPNFGRNPKVTGVAYTNSYLGATSTVLYDADLEVVPPIFNTTTTIRLAIQNPPNAGGLVSVQQDVQDKVMDVDIDIYNNLGTGIQTGFALSEYLIAPGTFANALGLIDFNTATITLVGQVGPVPTLNPVVDVAARIDRTLPALTGKLVYALSSTNNLLSFDDANPSFIRSLVPVTGITQSQIAGLDSRPATGELFALGYTTETGAAQLYTVNPATGAATPVGGGITLAANMGQIGFDFNPTVDRIRVVSASNDNYRLNPVTGGIAATDTQLQYLGNTPDPAVGAAAYLNSFSGAGTTTLYDIDEATGNLLTQVPPNNGTLNVVGSLGLALNGADLSNDLDIYYTGGVNTALLAASTGSSTSDVLYAVNLTTGAATPVGTIGGGISIRDITAQVVAGPLSWTGAVSTDWATAGNWATNVVPTTTSDVVIPAGAPRYPVVSGTQGANALLIATGASVTVAAAAALQVNGNVTNNGALTSAATGTVSLTSPGTQTLGGSAMMHFSNLMVGAGGATLDGAAAGLDVQRVLTLTGNVATNGRPFVLLSNATGTALVVNSGGAVTGSATAERYIQPTVTGFGYRHFSAPVTNSTFADLAAPGFTPVVNPAYNAIPTPALATYPNIFAYDESRAPGSPDFGLGYFSPNSLSDPMESGRGYSVLMKGTVKPDFVGTLGNGPVTRTGLTKTGNFTGGGEKSGWHLLGNPYPSPIDWDLVTIPAGLSPTVSVFRTSGGNNGTYAQYTNGVGPANTDLIPSAQGFFVRVTGAGPVNFTLTNSARVISYANPAHYRQAADPRPTLHLTLARAGQAAEQADEAFVYFEDGATPALDRSFDAEKLRAEGDAPSVFTVANGQELAINGQPADRAAAATVALGVVTPVAGTYVLNVADLRGFAAGAVVLVDRLTGTEYDLTTTAQVSFRATQPGTSLTRFALRFGQGGAATPALLTAALNVYPNPVAGTAALNLTVDGVTADGLEAVLFDVVGRPVVRQPLILNGQQATAALKLGGVARGTYTLRVALPGAPALTRQVVVE